MRAFKRHGVYVRAVVQECMYEIFMRASPAAAAATTPHQCLDGGMLKRRITLDRQFRLVDLKDRFGVVARDGKKGARSLERDMLRGVGFERGR